jgi:hypothetical protein
MGIFSENVIESLHESVGDWFDQLEDGKIE